MIKAILTDIEGTTSSLSFVKDVLFPYSRERMADFVAQHAQDPAVRKWLDEARQAAGGGFEHQGLATEYGVRAIPTLLLFSKGQVTEQLVRWIDEDKKLTPLKALQGMIWEHGYTHGDFRGHVYPDAERALRVWHEQGILLYVYSSGSVQAQRLLFGHTEYGDLTPLFTGYFDTSIGGKRDAESYQAIAKAIGFDAAEILFLSDVKAELDAARQAGMQSAWLVREGTVDPQADPPQVADFEAIRLPE